MHVEETNLRFFNAKPSGPRGSVRNPITHEGISDKERHEPSNLNPRGPGRAEYSNHAQGSFKLAYRPSEATQISKKNIRDFNNGRNPITQDTVKEDSKPAVNRNQFDKYYKSSIFEVQKQNLESPLKNRSNQKFHSSRVFEGEDTVYRPLCKKVEPRKSEVEGLMTHQGREVHSITEKPNFNRMNSSELVKSRQQANQMARVFNARRNNSNITFS